MKTTRPLRLAFVGSKDREGMGAERMCGFHSSCVLVGRDSSYIERESLTSLGLNVVVLIRNYTLVMKLSFLQQHEYY